jgi:uncharacterized protein YggE
MIRSLMFLPVVCLLGAAPAALAQTAADIPVIVTSGDAEVKKAPDRAWVGINAESRAKDPKAAQRANSEAMAAVMKTLSAAGIAESAIRTTAFDLQPEFDYANGRQTLRAYVARNAIEVRVDDITRVGDVLTAAVGGGATSVGGLRFDLKDREAAEREALGLAVRDARTRADAAASGAGMRVDRVLKIEDHRVQPQEPRPMIAMRMEGANMAAAPDVPVSAGAVSIRAMVTLTAAIK